MKVLTKVLTSHSDLDIRELVSVTLSLYCIRFSDCLFIDEFVPNLGFHPEVSFDELNYGVVTRRTELNVAGLFEDFRNILQLESLHVFTADDTMHLVVEDGGIFRLKVSKEFPIGIIERLVQE